MIKKGIAGCFLFFCLLPILKAQTEEGKDTVSPVSFTLIKSIDIEAKDIQTDRLGNLFVVTKSNQLYKYSPEGNLLGTLNYKYTGNISHVDATNPLEVYVFYKELNLIIFLDNNLAYRGEMKLDQMGIGQASAIARSFDNGAWAFDMADLQLKKTDKNGENLQSSGNIRQFVNSKTVTPTYVYDDNSRVFLNDSTIGVMVFDVFAHYLKTIPVKGCTEVKVIGDDLYYYLDGKIHKYNQRSFQTASYALPENKITDLSIEKGRLYLLLSNSIHIYTF